MNEERLNLTNKTSLYLFAVTVLLMSCFSLLLIGNHEWYDYLSREDNLIEYLTSVCLFISSLLLFKCFLLSRKLLVNNAWITQTLTLLGAILFFFAAGEEISWGQRLFDLETPRYLALVNEQNELNLHNVNKKLFDRLLDRSTIAFSVIGSILILLKKEFWLGIKMPDIFTVLAFTMTTFYKENAVMDFHHLQYLAIIALFILSYFYKNKVNLLAIVISIVMTIFIPFFHIKYQHLFPSHLNSSNEYREFLFSICCLFYAWTILTSLQKVNEKAQ